MFPDDLELVVFWQRPALAHVNSDNVQTTIVRSARKTVHALQDAYALHSGVMLTVRMSRLACYIPLQPSRVPYFNRLIVRSRHKKHVVRGDS